MTTEIFNDIQLTFENNQQSVRQLVNFDRILLDFCIMQVESLEGRLRTNEEIRLTNVIFLPTNTITALKNIRQNDSMRSQYESIFNQCLVLSVSHFSSTIHSIFKQAINHACCGCPELLKASSEDIKISFDELKSHHFDLTDSLGDLILKKKDISFQDMQSTHRAFKTFLDIDIEKDAHTNNIIVAQAARHSIVHALGQADEKFFKQIKDAFPRDLKGEIQNEQSIKFMTLEIESVQYSMKVYVDRLINNLNEKIVKSIPTELLEEN
jgi:hypothetical protein